MKIPVDLTLHEWSSSLDYIQATETLNLVFFYRKDPTRIPKKFHKQLEGWLSKNNLQKFIQYKNDVEKHQIILNQYEQLHRKVTEQ